MHAFKSDCLFACLFVIHTLGKGIPQLYILKLIITPMMRVVMMLNFLFWQVAFAECSACQAGVSSEGSGR